MPHTHSHTNKTLAELKELTQNRRTHAISCVAQEPLSWRLLALSHSMCIKRSYSFVRCSFDSLPSFTPTFLNIWVHYLFMLLVYLKWWLFIAIWREVVLVCAFFYAAFSSSSVFLSLVLGEYAFFSLFTHSVLSAARSEIKAKTKLPLEQVFLLVVTKREIKAYSSKKKKNHH